MSLPKPSQADKLTLRCVYLYFLSYIFTFKTSAAMISWTGLWENKPVATINPIHSYFSTQMSAGICI